MTIFAGPNGAGKSTLIRQAEFEGKDHLLDPDAVAKRLSADDPRRAAIAAGREVISRSRAYIASGQSFGIETTLSGTWIVDSAQMALESGFVVRVIYVCLDDPNQCVLRVGERVAQGGHHIPEDDVRRRYTRSLENVRKLMRIVHQFLAYDNSGPAPRLVLHMRNGQILFQGLERCSWGRTLV